jgi:Flp pilus assembly protein CpaB
MEQSLPGPQWLAGRRVIYAALILGAITAGLVVAFLATRDSADTVSPLDSDLVTVVVANREIEVGTVITAAMLELRELPRDAVISGAATDIEEVEGETARYPLVAGEQINTGRLVTAPSGKSLSFTIPEGLRGYTVPVDIERSPAALLVPGDFVDVIVAFGLIAQLPDGSFTVIEVEDGDQLKSAVTLLQNIQVLAVEREFVEDGVVYDDTTRGEMPEEDNIRYVTLAVSPEQAQQLWLITQDGELTLTIRGFGDDAADPIDPTDEPFNIPGVDEPAQLSQ